jgi:hypothetical protein
VYSKPIKICSGVFWIRRGLARPVRGTLPNQHKKLKLTACSYRLS